jgi:hypothetical protein
LQNISEMKKERMSYFSLTTFSDSHKLVQKCQLFWVVFHLLSVINLP